MTKKLTPPQTAVLQELSRPGALALKGKFSDYWWARYDYKRHTQTIKTLIDKGYLTETFSNQERTKIAKISEAGRKYLAAQNQKASAK